MSSIYIGHALRSPCRLLTCSHVAPAFAPRLAGELLHEATLELTEESQTFTFENMREEPLPSLLRGFSAPVKLTSDATAAQLAALAANDDDPFNRWDASQRLYTAALLDLVKSYQQSGGDAAALTLDPAVVDAFGATLADEQLDPSLVAYSLTLPDFSTLAQEMAPIDAGTHPQGLKPRPSAVL